MDNYEITVQCTFKTTLSINGTNLVVRRKDQETIYPLAKIQSFKFTEATLYNGGGIIAFKTSESADGSVYLGFGVSSSSGAEHSFGYKYKELENAKKLRDYITAHLSNGEIGTDGAEPGLGKVVSVVDEIRGLKSLLDEGILTQEEFDSKKKQLLGI